MKMIKYLTAILAVMVFFAGCQKELDFGNGGVSVGTLKTSGGNCLPSTVYGTYKKDTILNTGNYIDVQVNVTEPGTYVIATDTISGISFRGTGTLGNPGLNTVRLYGSGTPTVGGPLNFTVTYGTSSCLVTVTIEVPGGGGGGGLAIFTLGGTPGACTGGVANGTYTVGNALTAANTLTIEVNVTTAGPFLVGALPVNGMTFGAAGTFTSTGTQTLTLNGTGTPAAAGITNHTITAGTSSCTLSITTLAPGPQATFSFDGGPGNCTGATTAGTYTAGTALTAANTATITVNVATTGTYNITTNSVNGIVFMGTGTFTTTGSQPVILTGGGIPGAAGTFNYQASGSSSNCAFSVVFNPGAPANTDYFPLTQNSYWSYDFLANGITAPDSLYKVSDVQSSIGGNSYRNFKYGFGTSIDQLTRFRKSGSDYYQYILADTFSFFGFDTPQYGEILFLKENAAVNTTWESQEFTGLSSGVPIKLKYQFKIELVNTTLTVNGVTYTNVIKVAGKTMVDVGTGYIDDQLSESWYAKGIGLIKVRYWDATGSPTDDLVNNLRHYRVF